VLTILFRRFHDLAWSLPNDDHPRGVIAGALESGALDLWDAAKLLAGARSAFQQYFNCGQS
jgi:protein transport protein SEC31